MTLLQKINDFSISIKIGLMLAVPTIALIIFVLHITNMYKQELEIIEHAITATKLINNLDKVAHNVAIERGITQGVIASQGTKHINKLAKQRQLLDKQIAELNAYLKKINAQNLPLTEDFSNLDQIIGDMAKVRALINNNSKVEAFDYYSKLNRTILELMSKIVSLLNTRSAVNQLVSLKSLLWMKELAGQERGALNEVFTTGVLTG